MAAVVSVRLAPAVKQLQKALSVLFIHPVTGPSLFQIKVRVAPVDFHHSGRIARTLHPAFNLHGVDSRFYHIGNEIQGA